MRRISQQQLRQRRRKPLVSVARCATLGHDEVGAARQGRVALWAAIALALLSILTATGCNPFACFQHRHTGADFCGEPNIAYYYYPGAHWFVPSQQQHHCPVVTEQQFHGFTATCWTHWPEPWQPCPPPGYCGPGGPVGPEGLYPPHEDIGRPEAIPQAVPPLDAPTGSHRPQSPARVASLPARTPSVASPLNNTPQPVLPKLEFKGEHGFSTPEEGAAAGAVVVDLTAGEKIGGFSD